MPLPQKTAGASSESRWCYSITCANTHSLHRFSPGGRVPQPIASAIRYPSTTCFGWFWNSGGWFRLVLELWVLVSVGFGTLDLGFGWFWSSGCWFRLVLVLTPKACTASAMEAECLSQQLQPFGILQPHVLTPKPCTASIMEAECLSPQLQPFGILQQHVLMAEAVG